MKPQGKVRKAHVWRAVHLLTAAENALRPLKFPLPLPPLCRKWENPAPAYPVWTFRRIVSTSDKGTTRQGTCLGAFSYSGNEGTKNNAENAIKRRAWLCCGGDRRALRLLTATE